MIEESRILWERTLSERIATPEPAAEPEAGHIPGAVLVTQREGPPVAPALKPLPRTAALVATRTSVNRIRGDTAVLTRPAWSGDRLPVSASQLQRGQPTSLTVGRFVLRAYPTDNVAFVTAGEPTLLDFSLTLHRSELPDHNVAITGASAFFSIGVDLTGNVEKIARLQTDWTDALRRADLGGRHGDFGDPVWKFLPEQARARRITASLELPAGATASDPLVSVSPAAGVVSITVDLTESTALAWKAALEQGGVATIPGIAHIRVTSFIYRGSTLSPTTQVLDTPLGSLLAGRGAADIRTIDPQQTIQGKLIVVTNDLVERFTVALKPSQGQAPTNQVFGPEGGQIEVAVTAQDLSTVTIDWSAQVAFKPLGWPPVPASGQLNAQNIWTDLIKPDSWVATYTFMAIPVDDKGQAQQPAAAGPNPHTQGVLNFTAPYVANGLINSSFMADYNSPVTIALPRFPGEPFGDLVLTVFATRNDVGGNLSRKLAPDELNVVALIYPDGHVQIITNSDALPETSAASDVLRLMASI
jgi:hypothetical protein